jgi:hypothetical protein
VSQVLHGRAKRISHEKMQGFPRTSPGHLMDAEQINQIGTTLADLSERTADLRRYL